jgi:two-component system LytT family response regulator
MKVLLVDDERLARQEMRRLLAEHPDVEILDEAAHAGEAAEKLEIYRPDLMFLDISMPGKTGFEFLSSLTEAPRVVFVTAFDQYALKAFEVNALDYLVKPVDADRLARTLEKIRGEMKRSERPMPVTDKMVSSDRQVFLKDGDKCYFVRMGDVWLIESIGNYARLYFEGQNAMLHRSLNQLEERLDPALFFRANRQEIINMEFIQKIDPFFNGALRIALKSGRLVEVSVRQAAVFRERMGL